MRGNVLFVEDEEALRMTVGDRLRNEGYAVEYARQRGRRIREGHAASL